jgi:Lrp/AsnC family leucine-responsive transcriptional regulator
VLTASLLTGSFDFSLGVVCTDRADLAAVTEFIRDKAGAQETYSRIVLRSIRVGEPAPREPSAESHRAPAAARRRTR